MGASVRPIGPPRFAVAVHILVELARCGSNLSSAAIADQVNSHATFMRRILARLAQAGLVEAREGRDGGYTLKLPAERITLADVFVAIRWESQEEAERGACGEPVEPAESACAEVDRNERLDRALAEIMEDIDQHVLERLREHTIASLM